MITTTSGRLARLFLPFIFVLSLMASPMLEASTAAQTNSSSEINRTLAEISRAEREGDLNLIYDLMLPEARYVIPRATFVNWYPTVAPAAPADVLKLGDLTFGDLDYALTDTSFGDVATVSYTYHDAEGADVERTMQLVEVDNVWRWIPDITKDDLPEIQTHAGYTVNFESAFTTPLYQDLDTYWAQIFSDWGVEYRSPKDMIGVRVEGTPSGCGPIDDLDAVFAHYCTLDEVIYFNPDMRDMIINRIGDAGWEMVIAHEWAHHIQNISGRYVTKSPELFGGNYTIEHELQADCLAATFMQDATARGIFEQRDRQVTDSMLEMGGDARGTTWDDITAHGSADQRRESYYVGFDDGLRGCNLRN